MARKSNVSTTPQRYVSLVSKIRLYHPKVIASLGNLMQIQALPVSSLEASSATSEEQNEHGLNVVVVVVEVMVT